MTESWSRRTAPALVVLAALVSLFVALAASVTQAGAFSALDAAAHAALFDAVGPARVEWIRGVTFFGNNATIVTAVTLLCVAFALRRRAETVVRLLAASGAGAFVIVSLKALFSRDRPLEQVVEAAGYSFPSGHAFASTVFYGMLVVLTFRATRRASVRVPVAVVCGLVILAVGLSRVYLNVHYLTDVVAGWTAGAAWLVASQLAVNAAVHRWSRG